LKDISFVFVFNNDSLKRSLRGKYKRVTVRVSKHRPYRQRVQFVNLGVTVRVSRVQFVNLGVTVRVRTQVRVRVRAVNL